MVKIADRLKLKSNKNKNYCYKCEQCGEIVFSASVMEKIDDMLEHLEKIASKIFIVDYAGAA